MADWLSHEMIAPVSSDSSMSKSSSQRSLIQASSSIEKLESVNRRKYLLGTSDKRYHKGKAMLINTSINFILPLDETSGDGSLKDPAQTNAGPTFDDSRLFIMESLRAKYSQKV